jgi:hypothetical protein
LYLCQYIPFPAYQRLDRRDSSDANWVCVRVRDLGPEAKVGFFLLRAIKWFDSIPPITIPP